MSSEELPDVVDNSLHRPAKIGKNLGSPPAARVDAFILVFRTHDVPVSRFDLFVAEAPGKVQFELPAFIIAAGHKILTGKIAAQRIGHRMEDVADRCLYRCVAIEQGFLQTRIEAPYMTAY